MAVDLSLHFSDVSKARGSSAINDMYTGGFTPGQANLGAGLPHPDFFPCRTLQAEVVHPPNSLSTLTGRITPPKDSDRLEDDLRQLTVPFRSRNGIDVASALQYGQPSGYPGLLETIRNFVRNHLHPVEQYEGGPEVILTNGSTDGMSKCLELFTNTWSKNRDAVNLREGLLVEKFLYPAVLTQAEPRGLNVVPVEVDRYGMKSGGVNGLRDVLDKWDFSRGKRPHIMYTVSVGNNPTGSVMSIPRRQELYEIACDYDIVIVEDEPYWFLEYTDPEKVQAFRTISAKASETSPFLKSLSPTFMDFDRDGRVVRLDTFSKMFAPGCRLGWMTAQPAVIDRISQITEAFADQPSGFVQSIIAAMLRTQARLGNDSHQASKNLNREPLYWQIDGWMRQLSHLRSVYQQRMTLACEILQEGAVVTSASEGAKMGSQEVSASTTTQMYSFDWPGAGMFVWLHMKFSSHPLFEVCCDDDPNVGVLITGKMLSEAMAKFMCQAPYLVKTGSGAVFGATEAVQKQTGWQYCRICFAAEDDDLLEGAIQRFVEGVHAFWRLDDLSQIAALLA